MSIETLDDIVEELADKFGIYGAGPEDYHTKDCKCRNCFCTWLKERIKKAAEVERLLKERGASWEHRKT